MYEEVWAFLRGEVESRTFFEDIHRRYGKSHVLMLIAIEVGMGKAPEVWPDLRRIIRFSAPTMLDLEEIYHPIVEEILDDCPDDLRPIWRATRGRGHYLFPATGSQLYLFGIDAKHYKKGRGKKTHLAVVDEAGACEPACEGGVSGYVRSILVPQTFGVNGRIVIPTTPPETPGHSSSLLRAACQAVRGAYVKRTLDDNAAFFGADVVREYERECGGRDTTAFRREYLCEWIVDETRAVVPEFDAHEAAIVKAPAEPAWYFPLVGMDVGFEDWHAALFGFWDFERAILCILHELFLRRATTDEIADGVKDREGELWPWLEREHAKSPNGFYLHEPWRKDRRDIFRFSDTDLRLIQDLSVLHGLKFSPTKKDDKEAQVNETRLLVKQHRIEIHPRCVNLIRHLKTAVWNRARTGFDRTDFDGHYDGVDALIYTVRNAPRTRNPFPAVPELVNRENTVVLPQPQRHTNNGALVASIYGR